MTKINFSISRPICFFDTETTGPSPAQDKIVSISVMKIFPDGRIEERSALVNPGIPIPPEATEVHGITDEMVEGKPAFKLIAKALFAFFTGCDLGGYNIQRFDVPLLVEEFMRCGIDAFPEKGVRMIDPYIIFKNREPRDLSAAVKFFCKKEMEDAHDSLADTRAAYDIFKAQLRHYEDISQMDFFQVVDLCKPDKPVVDFAGKFSLKDDEYVFNFGKHKGQIVRTEPKYLEWMLKADDFTLDTKKWVRTFLDKK